MARKALGKGLDALIPGAGGDESSSSAAARKSKPGRPGQAGTVTKVRLGRIRPNPFQPRQDFAREGLEELADSIREKGVLQPVLLRAVEDEEGEEAYQLVAGERRLRAAEIAGLKSIPAIVYEVDSDEEMLELALVENVQRENLNAMDTARAYRRLADDCGLTQEQIAERVGKSRTSVANTLRLLSLPEQVRQAVKDEKITEGHARALLGLGSSGARITLLKKIIARGLSVRATEKLVREAAADDEGEGPRKRGQKELPPRLQALVEEFQRALGTRVTLKGSVKKGSLKIDYYSADDLTRICDRLDISLD
ncbi:MAG: ParB/RepB/Spo0J family partition protein [bacterium]